MDKRKIILDCDPGHDDAVAIMLAGKSSKIELLGITCSSGNQTIEKTSRNAYNLVKYLNINVPVAVGTTHPIVREVEVCEKIHGESGLDGFEFPKYDYKFEKRHAVNFIIDTLLENNDVTMVVTGPLTNFALALRINPEIKKHLREVILMGGSMMNGNTSPAAEFNILCDPEAADIVFKSGLVVKMVGLDVTRKVLLYPSILESYKNINTKSAKLFNALMKVFNENQADTFGFVGAPLHDPATILSIIDEDLITFKKMNVEIDLSHGCSYGRTNCDFYNYLNKEPNAYVAVDINVERYWELIKEHLMIE